MRIRFSHLLFVAPMALGCSAYAQQCSQSSQFMDLACRSEAREDFWTAYANCRQTEDNGEVHDCWMEAGDERAEAFGECGDITDARNDLCDALGDTIYDPEIDPANFLSPEDAAANPNPYLPLVPGTTWIYEGEEEIVTVTVTEETRVIQGVECFAVRDIVTDQEGETVEDTIDWFAVDVDGNVWYFGEISQNFEDGILVDVEGSFTAGEDEAKAGVVMLADPMPGDVYRQEFALGEAEDAGEVVSLMGDESVEIADCEGGCLVTRDFTPLEPDVEENKYYLPGIGLILEVDLEEGERVELVEIIDP